MPNFSARSDASARDSVIYLQAIVNLLFYLLPDCKVILMQATYSDKHNLTTWGPIYKIS